MKIPKKIQKFAIDAGIRAVRTMAQTALAGMTVGATISEVKWGQVLSAALVAGVYSILMSLNNLSASGSAPLAIEAPAATEEKVT